MPSKRKVRGERMSLANLCAILFLLATEAIYIYRHDFEKKPYDRLVIRGPEGRLTNGQIQVQNSITNSVAIKKHVIIT